MLNKLLTAVDSAIRPTRVAHAHSGTHSYAIVEVEQGRAKGTIQFPIAALNDALGLSIPLDETQGVAAIEAHREVLDAYIADHFALRDPSGNWSVLITGHRVLERKAFSYAIFDYEVTDRPFIPERFTMDVNGIVDFDASHEGIAIVREHAGLGPICSKWEQRFPVTSGTTSFDVEVRPPSFATNVSGAWQAVVENTREFLRRARKRLRRSLKATG